MVHAAEMLVPGLASGGAANNNNNNVGAPGGVPETVSTPTTPKMDLKTTTIVMSKHTLGPHTSTVSSTLVC